MVPGFFLQSRATLNSGQEDFLCLTNLEFNTLYTIKKNNLLYQVVVFSFWLLYIEESCIYFHQDIECFNSITGKFQHGTEHKLLTRISHMHHLSRRLVCKSQDVHRALTFMKPMPPITWIHSSVTVQAASCHSCGESKKSNKWAFALSMTQLS